MLRKISLKAFVVSNLAHWVFMLLGVFVPIALYGAAATMSSDGHASLATVFQDMRSSSGFMLANLLIFFLVPIPAGYIAAKIARQAKLLNGALSVSMWFAVSAYVAIWGGGDAEGPALVPHWLSVLTSYGIPIPAMLGAHLWSLRAARRASSAAESDQDHVSAIPQPNMAAPQTFSKWRPHLLGLTVFLLLHLVPEQHGRTTLTVAFVAISAIVIIAVMVRNAMRPRST